MSEKIVVVFDRFFLIIVGFDHLIMVETTKRSTSSSLLGRSSVIREVVVDAFLIES